MDETLPLPKDVTESAWKSVLAFIGVTYLTGFLVLFTFFNRMGIERSGGELLRIRYIHVGVLCLGFPVFVMLPVIALIWIIVSPLKEAGQAEPQGGDEQPADLAHSFGLLLGKPFVAPAVWLCEKLKAILRVGEKSEEAPKKDTRSVRPSLGSGVLILGSLGFTFYCVVLFSSRHYLYEKLPWLTLMLAISLLPGPLLRFLKGLLNLSPDRGVLDVRVTQLVAVASAVGAFLILRGLFPVLFQAFRAGYMYVVLLLIAAYLAWTYVVLWASSHRSHIRSTLGRRTTVYVAGAAIIIVLYLLATLTFAHRVFPFIPVSNGGGNYADSPDVVICMRPTWTGQLVLPESLSPPPPPSKPADPPAPAAAKARNKGQAAPTPAAAQNLAPQKAECSVPVKIIDSTEGTVFVARSDDYGHDDEQRNYADTDGYKQKCKPGSENCPIAASLWSKGRYLPKIYALNRSDVVTVEYNVSLIAAGPKSP
jgi:hypothetical protein